MNYELIMCFVYIFNILSTHSMSDIFSNPDILSLIQENLSIPDKVNFSMTSKYLNDFFDKNNNTKVLTIQVERFDLCYDVSGYNTDKSEQFIMDSELIYDDHDVLGMSYDHNDKQQNDFEKHMVENMLKISICIINVDREICDFYSNNALGLQKCDNLQWLIISNKTTFTIMNSSYDFTNLVCIDIRDGSHFKFDKKDITCCPNLEEICLGDNCIFGCKDRNIGPNYSFEKLDSIYIGSNCVVLMNEFDAFPNLTHLEIEEGVRYVDDDSLEDINDDYSNILDVCTMGLGKVSFPPSIKKIVLNIERVNYNSLVPIEPKRDPLQKAKKCILVNDGEIVRYYSDTMHTCCLNQTDYERYYNFTIGDYWD